MTPLLSLNGIGRTYRTGRQEQTVLQDVTLDIMPGEMVAIIGTSGSGKSTLMNILGCLDTPSVGTYLFGGRDVGNMSAEERAELRREHFGFIFQRYQLLGDHDALGNVEVPAVYAGTTRRQRRRVSHELLDRLGLKDREDHKPSELSGGQQQRVSVARALVNGGEVILADEPTGALDTTSGEELMALLAELNARGHTIIIVTHDPLVAEKASRIIEIRDGKILADTRKRALEDRPRMELTRAKSWGPLAMLGRLSEAFGMAWRAMAGHRLRSFLTMLGIIIGIASVVSVVALGRGSQDRVLAQIAQIGTSTITIRPGSGFGDRRSGSIKTLVASDALALAEQPYAASVSPEINTNATITWRSTSASAQINGVGAGYFDAGGFKTTRGTVFGARDVTGQTQVAVLDTLAFETYFPDGEDPIGKVILANRIPLQVIGVVDPAGTSFGSQNPRIYVPNSTVGTRLTGQADLDAITIRVNDTFEMATAELLITDLMTQRHGRQDFFLLNSDSIRDTIQSTTRTLTFLVSAIALISLAVGGIGVMNIMLVSVTERTREIGVRMAVGARRSDIIMQFLIEAVLVCLIGGMLGVALAYAIGEVISRLTSVVSLTFQPQVALLAFVASSVIGVVFGYLPARSASRLDPVAALARD
ncbi:MAG: MacB family efflux pump subunit [Deltaproteobacteria bacterium]